MSLSHVSLIFKKLEPVDQCTEGDNLIAGLTANPLIFIPADLPMAPAAFGIINDKYRSLTNDAKSGDTTKIQLRKDYYDQTWLPAMMEFVLYVDKRAAHNAAIIVQSGFHATKEDFTTHVEPVKMEIILASKNHQQVDYDSKTKVDSHDFLLIGSVKGAISIVQDENKITITAADGTKIVLVTDTHKKGTVKGLTTKDEMEWQMVATNAAGSGPLSEKVSVLVS